MAADKLEQLVARLEVVTGRLESVASRGGAGGGGSAGAGDDDPIWYDDFQPIHNGKFADFVKLSKELGGELAVIADNVKKAFDAHLNILTIAARNGRPKDSDLQAILKPLSDVIVATQSYRESNRNSKQFHHLSAISEGIPFLGWVAVAPKPAAYVQQMEESAQFYTNKVLKEFRESDPKQADWAKSFIQLLKAFAAYIKDNHGTGLSWNKEKPAATAATTAGASPSGGGAPPPPPVQAPPPPPPVQAPAASGGSSGGADDRSKLFAQLNQGSGVTSGLKKVSDDMKTHKNPSLRNQPPAKSDALAPRPYSSPQFKRFSAPETKKPPVFELQMKKWVIENQENNQGLVISDTNDKQVVYMYKCKNTVLQVKGKINSITLDNCQKCGVVFEDLISTCEFINCQSVKAQANGKVPTISVDKTDGAQLYLNQNSLNAQIITAKSSEMNICITKEDGDLTEVPIPEQFKTVWDGNKFVTTTMDLNL